MKLYELQIEDNEDEVFAISLVESPAIESDFIYFDKEKTQFAAVDTEKKMLNYIYFSFILTFII